MMIDETWDLSRWEAGICEAVLEEIDEEKRTYTYTQCDRRGNDGQVLQDLEGWA